MVSPAKREWACTSCGGDATLAYVWGPKGADWQGRVKRGERLCTRCFRGRGGAPFFGPGSATPPAAAGKRR